MDENPPVSLPFVERLSEQLQHVIQILTGAQRTPPRHFKSFLTGTWFGHPLHPALITVPITAWLLTTIFDVLWIIGSGAFAWAARSAEITILLGLLAALGAIVTGLTDWSDTYGAERRVGLYHAAFNAIATLLYLVSSVLRFLYPSGENLPAAVLSLVGLTAVLYAAYLGGDLVFTKGTGVNHTAWEAGSEQYEVVLSEQEVEDDKLYRVTAAGVPVLVLRQREQWYAISATCPHAGAPLDEGMLQGDIVECPWHGSRFCLRDGRVLTGPATVNAPRYDIRVREGQVEVKRQE
ncbi:Rieske 2Fe-2S domain-containing protein [Ktedonospora formicarum]|uniref:Rieske domain-containing protein n=1 Tax=Ktedonospora formicarum TaxID=2778364 RepID=A0A8J3MPT9_9CHLR|nr:Rieske 2Fe-2S domain-containing protein [Ktedonospora formicarum]GHO42101.1 hypothetical protein KSX_02640 [Ktedonospora formicarum]